MFFAVATYKDTLLHLLLCFNCHLCDSLLLLQLYVYDTTVRELTLRILAWRLLYWFVLRSHFPACTCWLACLSVGGCCCCSGDNIRIIYYHIRLQKPEATHCNHALDETETLIWVEEKPHRQ